MSKENKTITVSGLTKFGIQTTDGERYSFSKFLKDKDLKAGDVLNAELYAGPQGGKYLNSFTRVAAQEAHDAGEAVRRDNNHPLTISATEQEEIRRYEASIPLPPSLPPTSVGETKAPGGVAPVAPAKKRPNENGATGIDSEKMTKADWANKDSRIETVAVLKSVLESPAFAQLVVGKRKGEAFEIGAEMFSYFLEKLRAA